MNSTQTTICQKCGGAQFHGTGSFVWNGPICQCGQTYQQIQPNLSGTGLGNLQTPFFGGFQPIAKGWECPKCKVVHAPWMPNCQCQVKNG